MTRAPNTELQELLDEVFGSGRGSAELRQRIRAFNSVSGEAAEMIWKLLAENAKLRRLLAETANRPG
jgi:hypothetical protein